MSWWRSFPIAGIVLLAALSGCSPNNPSPTPSGSATDTPVAVAGICIYTERPFGDSPEVPYVITCLPADPKPTFTTREAMDTIPQADREGLEGRLRELVVVACSNGPGIRGIGNPAKSSSNILQGIAAPTAIREACQKEPGVSASGKKGSSFGKGRSGPYEQPTSGAMYCGAKGYGPVAAGHSPGYYKTKLFWKSFWEGMDPKNLLDVWEAAFTGDYPKDSEITGLAATYDAIIKEREEFYPVELEVDQAMADAEQAESQVYWAEIWVEEDPDNPEATRNLLEARQAAEAARKAANASKQKLDEARKAGTPNEKKQALSEASALADNAAKARKVAEERAEKAKESKPKDIPGGTTQEPTDPAPAPDPNDQGTPSDDSLCSEAAEFIAECEASHWTTAPCQLWLWKLQGCDATLINPGEGPLCDQPGVTEEQVEAALVKACGSPISKPDPDNPRTCGAKLPSNGAVIVVDLCQEEVGGVCPTTAPVGQWKGLPRIYCPPRDPRLPPVGCFPLS